MDLDRGLVAVIAVEEGLDTFAQVTDQLALCFATGADSYTVAVKYTGTSAIASSPTNARPAAPDNAATAVPAINATRLLLLTTCIACTLPGERCDCTH